MVSEEMGVPQSISYLVHPLVQPVSIYGLLSALSRVVGNGEDSWEGEGNLSELSGLRDVQQGPSKGKILPRDQMHWLLCDA